MPKKILIITEVFHPESTMLNDFIPEVVKSGLTVEVLCRQPSYPYGKIFDGYTNDFYTVDNWNGIKIHRIKTVEGYKNSKFRKILNYWEFVRIGNEIVKKISKDFDHIIVYQTGPLTVALPGVTIKKKCQIPLTIWTCDIWPDAVYAYGFPKVFPLPQLIKYIITKVYRNADNILVSSKQFAETINHYVKGRNIVYTPNWLVEEPQTTSQINIDKSTFNFLFAGNISISQNLGNILKGWHLASLSNAQLNIVGDGSKLDDLKKLVNQRDIKNVIFHGRWPSSQMQSLFAQVDALILPLTPNGGIDKTEPYKLQSYLKAQKPIFGVIKGSGQEIIEQNQLGLCADPIDINDIAQKFKQMISFADQNRIAIADKAQELLNGRFSRTITVEKIISIIQQ